MRKKLLSLALALAMCLGLAAPALAADDTAYTQVVPCKYERVGDFSEGLAAVMLNGKWGFIDKTGKEVIPCQYENADYTTDTAKNPHFSEGLALMCLNDKWGYIDKTGKEVVPFQYDYASDFSEGLAAVAVKNGQSTPTKYGTVYERDYSFIDKTGEKVASLPGRTVMPLSEGLAAIQVGTYLDWTSGYIDNTGKIVIPCQYGVVEPFSEGLALVRDATNESRGYIDQTGKVVIPCQYTGAWSFSEGLAAVYVGEFPLGKIGFIDKTGKMVIPAQYGGSSTTTYVFSEGLVAIQNGKWWGFLDKTGKEVIPFQFNVAKNFSEGLAVVGRAGKYGYIDKAGKEVVPCQYAWASSVSEGMAAVAVAGEESGSNNFRWGFISLGGAQPTVSTVGGFSDVKTSDYFADPVLWAVEKEITAGTGNNKFSPDQNCTNAQILTFIWRAYGKPEPTIDNPFTNSIPEAYAKAAIWAYEKGMVSGAAFDADKSCTRAMAATYLWQAAGSPPAPAASFTDVPANAAYAPAVAWAVEKGITSGTGNGQFSPNSICNRGQIVTFLYRAFAK